MGDAQSQTLVGEVEGAAPMPSQLRAPSKRTVSVNGSVQGSQQLNSARGVPAEQRPPSPQKISSARTGSYSDMAGRKLRRNAGSSHSPPALSPLASPNDNESREFGNNRSA